MNKQDRQSLIKSSITKLEAMPQFRSLLIAAIAFLTDQFRNGRILSLNGQDASVIVERMKVLLVDVDVMMNQMSCGFVDRDEVFASSSTSGDK